MGGKNGFLKTVLGLFKPFWISGQKQQKRKD
jgi:hypothetical protein